MHGYPAGLQQQQLHCHDDADALQGMRKERTMKIRPWKRSRVYQQLCERMQKPLQHH